MVDSHGGGQAEKKRRFVAAAAVTAAGDSALLRMFRAKAQSVDALYSHVFAELSRSLFEAISCHGYVGYLRRRCKAWQEKSESRKRRKMEERNGW